MRVKMLKTRNYTPQDDRRITVKYREGHGYTVKRVWGEEMVRDGDAEEVEAPPLHGLDHDGDGEAGGSLPAHRGRFRRKADAEAS